MAVPKGYNAKGIALFIQGLINLYKTNKDSEYLRQAYKLADIIISQRAKNRDYFCVGYNFFWEARAFSVPAFTPNMIVSSFVGQSFLDLYDIGENKKWLQYGIEIGNFIEKELILYDSKDEMCFGYIPQKSAIVHNANLMGARLFARLFSYTNNKKYKNFSIKSVQFSTKAQKDNGAWVYGERNHHQWIDNFHTGFNLIAIKDVQRYLKTKQWQNSINIGLNYHLKNHFLSDMTPKFYDNKLYPIDIHNFAQGIYTLLTFGYKEKAEQLLKRCIELMWNEKEGYFYYQKTKLYKNKINYIRWSQAWMFYALTIILIET
ncbi:MAG: aspartate-semialdehyde dehydrogenase [Candidatus Cloacimonetes bacterium]|nr:aspartate-semialdehyde dehydrogenase [Candidatus Cloacimonadota bacterium]